MAGRKRGRDDEDMAGLGQDGMSTANEGQAGGDGVSQPPESRLRLAETTAAGAGSSFPQAPALLAVSEPAAEAPVMDAVGATNVPMEVAEPTADEQSAPATANLAATALADPAAASAVPLAAGSPPSAVPASDTGNDIATAATETSSAQADGGVVGTTDPGAPGAVDHAASTAATATGADGAVTGTGVKGGDAAGDGSANAKTAPATEDTAAGKAAEAAPQAAADATPTPSGAVAQQADGSTGTAAEATPSNEGSAATGAPAVAATDNTKEASPGTIAQPPQTGTPAAPSTASHVIKSEQEVAVNESAAGDGAPAAVAAANMMSGSGNAAPGTPAQPGYPRLKVEDALSYLDQVKMQFGNKPQVYNQFLDIMKEFKSQSIDTPGVIRRVSELFEGHPDLIVGFNTFLPPGYKIEVPDQSGRIVYSQPGQPGVTNAYNTVTTTTQAQGQTIATGGAGQPAAPATGNNQPAERKQAPEFNHAINYVNKIKTRFAHQLDIYKAFLEILHTYQQERRTIEEVYQQVATLFRSHPDLLEEFSQFLPEATTAHQAAMQQQAAARQAKASNTAKRARTQQWETSKAKAKKVKELSEAVGYQEHAFFDKVKKNLKSRQVYENFLRCLNLYSHEIINRNELVLLVSGFLRRFPELLQWFKNFVGYREGGVEQVAGGKPDIDPAQQLDLSTCKRLDTSYRALPESHRAQLCTGRAKLPDHVAATLNDGWVSFPTVWSEDSPFLVQKKNMFEDAIFRTEDERFELDVVIESNLSTIRVLEMVLRQLERMTPEQRSSYKFNTRTLGGSSEMIHRKAVLRLYGEDKVEDVFAALKRDPYTFIPVVLRRLKQKHTEWRNTQRQWNQIWRESNEKNYLKSLDYKSQQFKRTDPMSWKRLKHKMKEMRDEYREYRRTTTEGVAPEGTVPPPPVRTFTFTDTDLFADCSRLLVHHLKRSAFGAADKEKMESLLCTFLPEFLYLGGAPQDSASPSVPDVEMNDASQDVVAAASAQEEPSEPGSDAKPTSISAVMTKVQRPATKLSGATANTHLFFANNKWYTFHALYQLLYERVLEIKQLSKKIAEEFEAKAPKRDARLLPAVSLALCTKLDVSHDKYYETFLSLVEKYLDNQIETVGFEENMREMFNTKAYKVFTIDKLIAAIVRQIQTLITDTASQSLHAAYLQHQEKVAAAPGAAMASLAAEYKESIKTILESNNVFRIEQKAPRTLVIELLDLEHEEPDADDTATEKWMKYVEKYVRMQSTGPEIEALLKKPIFLKRNKRAAGFAGDEDRAMQNVKFQNNLECKICVNTYKMRFVSQSEDYFCRSNGVKSKQLHKQETRRHEKFADAFRPWRQQNVTSETEAAAADWLLEGGTTATPCADGIHDCKTYQTANDA